MRASFVTELFPTFSSIGNKVDISIPLPHVQNPRPVSCGQCQALDGFDGVEGYWPFVHESVQSLDHAIYHCNGADGYYIPTAKAALHLTLHYTPKATLCSS